MIVDETLVSLSENESKEGSETQVDNVCDICGKKFETLKKFKQHLKIHQINSVSCDVCPKSFTSKNYMNKHIKNVHQSKT